MGVKTKNIMAVLCVSALAIPAGVAAKGPGSNVDLNIVDVKSANKHAKPWLTPPASGSNLEGTYNVPSGSNLHS